MTEQRKMIGEWQWPLVADALETVGIWPIKEYIQHRQANIEVQWSFRPIYYMCTVA